MFDEHIQTGALAPLRPPPKRPSIERPVHANPDDWADFTEEPLPVEWDIRQAHHQFRLYLEQREYTERQARNQEERAKAEAKFLAENPEPASIEERLSVLEARMDKLATPTRLQPKSAKSRAHRSDDFPPAAA